MVSTVSSSPAAARLDPPVPFNGNTAKGNLGGAVARGSRGGNETDEHGRQRVHAKLPEGVRDANFPHELTAVGSLLAPGL